MFRFFRDLRDGLRYTTKLSFSRLVFSIGIAGIETVWVLYMMSFGLSVSTIGFINAFLVVVSLIASFFSTILLEKIDEFKILIFSMVLTAVCSVLLFLFRNLYFFILVALFFASFMVLRINSFDILFRDGTKRRELNKDEGFLYSLLNFGWFVGPLIAGFFIGIYGLSSVFLTSAFFMVLAVFILIASNVRIPQKVRVSYDFNIWKNVCDYFGRRRLVIPYLVAGGVEIWWALIYIYMPLFIVRAGFDLGMVGVFLAGVILPMVFLEFEIGKLSQKYGFRIFFVLGFFLMGILALISFGLSDLHYVIFFMLLASIPMAFVEPLQSSYFFSMIRKRNDEEKYYPVFASSRMVGSLVSKFSVAGFLLFLPQNYAFLVIAVFMICIGLVCLRIRD